MLQIGGQMPPKAKFTKEEIIDVGLMIVREHDISYVTAREIGKRLGSSPRPIFTSFSGMNEVLLGIKDKARAIYDSYVEKALKEDLAFKAVGQAYIAFAIREPKLFQLLFMQKQEKAFEISKVLKEIENNYDAIVSSIVDHYGVDKKTAIELYRHLWIYSHGIATLCATSVCKFKGEEISDMITTVFRSLLQSKLSGK